MLKIRRIKLFPFNDSRSMDEQLKPLCNLRETQEPLKANGELANFLVFADLVFGDRRIEGNMKNYYHIKVL